MFKNLFERPMNDGSNYIECAGLSTDTKPVANLANGSLALEVDTGNISVFNESGGQWVDMFTIKDTTETPALSTIAPISLKPVAEIAEEDGGETEE